DARAFSALMHGAQLLYNLLLAEEYEAAGFDRLSSPADGFIDALSRWAEDLPSLVDLQTWDLDALLARVETARRSPINMHSRRFVRGWRDLLIEERTEAIAQSSAARTFMI